MNQGRQTFFVTTSGETNQIPDLLECAVVRILSGPNRSDYILVNVLSSYRVPQLILATRHQGDSMFELPDKGSIGAYIIELNRVLAHTESFFEREDIRNWTLGAVYGPEGAKATGICLHARE